MFTHPRPSARKFSKPALLLIMFAFTACIFLRNDGTASAAGEERGGPGDSDGGTKAPLGAPLTFGELHGKSINIKSNREMTALVNGRHRSWRQLNKLLLSIRPGNIIEFKRETISYLPSGPNTVSRDGASLLGQMHPVKSLGG